MYKYIRRIKANKPARVGPRGGQWNIKPAVENEMAEATRNHNITSFDHLSDQIMMLQSERDATVYKKESLRTAQRRRKRQNITRVKGTEESEARKLSVADPRTFTTLYACIQVSHVWCVHNVRSSLLHCLHIAGRTTNVWYADHSIWSPIGRRVSKTP